MIDHAHAAGKATGHSFKILMDLGGPKIRTGAVRLPEGRERVRKGALLAIVPPDGLDRVVLDEEHFSIECTLTEALSAAKVGDRVYVDDGKLGAKIERVESWGLIARTTRSTPICSPRSTSSMNCSSAWRSISARRRHSSAG
jgi:pyruvate kinase